MIEQDPTSKVNSGELFVVDSKAVEPQVEDSSNIAYETLPQIDQDNSTIKLRHIDREIATLDCIGQFTVHNSDFLNQKLHSLFEGHIYTMVLNFEQTSYLDSTTYAVLIHALRSAQEKNGRIVLVSTNPEIKKTFNITGLKDIFDIYKSEAEALQALRPIELQDMVDLTPDSSTA